MDESTLNSPWPFAISLGIALTLLGISGKILISGIAGLVILLIAVLGWMKEGFDETFVVEDEPLLERWPFTDVEKVKLGMWVFLAGEVVFFGAILASYVFLRLNTPNWPSAGELLNISQGTLNTFILLTSSFTLALSLAYIVRGEEKKFKTGLIITFLLGTIFLAIKLSEWRELLGHGFNPQNGLHASTYYFTTGIHGLHLLAGLIGLLYIIIKAFKRGYSIEKHSTIENFGLYWHFVDIIWVIIFPLFYLIS